MVISKLLTNYGSFNDFVFFLILDLQQRSSLRINIEGLFSVINLNKILIFLP